MSRIFVILVIANIIFSMKVAYGLLLQHRLRSATRSTASSLSTSETKRFSSDDRESEFKERKGKQRRALRSIAARMIQQEITDPDSRSIDRLETISVKLELLTESGFVRNVEETLRARELVKLKILGGGLKKKDVKAAGLRLTEDIENSELIQVVGHTLLLYLPGEGPVNKMLRREL